MTGSYLLLSLGSVIVVVSIFCIFVMIWLLCKENKIIRERLSDKVERETHYVYTTEVHNLNKRLEVLADYLNVKIVDQKAKTVVIAKGEKE